MDDAITRAKAPVTALWLDERLQREGERKAASAASKAARVKREKEAESARLEKRTRGFVEGQLLWLQEIKNVKPLAR